MSTTAEAPATDDHAGHDAHHPSDWQYIQIALWLALLTAIEVGTYFESVHKASDTVLYIVLTVLMVVKFALVGAYFMHLKQDTVLFRRLFYAGIFLAMAVYFVMLSAFRIWD